MWILIGVLLILFGFICALNPGVTLTSIALLLGIVLLISGLDDIFVYFKIHQDFSQAGWILAEGILTTILALLCLFNQMITTFTIPMIFSIWILFVGVTRIVSSFTLKDYGVEDWYLMLFTGILLSILGIASVFKPILASFTISMIVGFILIMQGVAVLIKGYYIDRVIKGLKKLL